MCLACCRDGGRKRRDHLQRDWVSGEVTAISFNWFSRRQIRPEIAAEPREAARTKSPTPALTLCNACHDQMAGNGGLPSSLSFGQQRRWISTMRLVTMGLAAALALTSTFALAQSGSGSAGGSSSAGGSAASGTTTGSSTNGTTTGSSTTGGANNNAGSAAAGANSQYNPSGNSLMNTSPSGSTVGPNSSGAGR